MEKLGIGGQMIPADKIDKACEVVYERITGKCWHTPLVGPHKPCQKCHTTASDRCKNGEPIDNPPLATSLDAWRPIWDAMDGEVFTLVLCQVNAIMGTNGRGFLDPMIWLAAAINWLKVEL